LVPQGRCHRA